MSKPYTYDILSGLPERSVDIMNNFITPTEHDNKFVIFPIYEFEMFLIAPDDFVNNNVGTLGYCLYKLYLNNPNYWYTHCVHCISVRWSKK